MDRRGWCFVLTWALVSCAGSPPAEQGRPSAAIPSAAELAQQSPPEACTLASWEDGDTPNVVCGSGKEGPVRLLGIDTPESGFDGNSQRRGRYQAKLWGLPVEQVFACGKAATRRAQELCPGGSAVQVIGNARDKYDRRLAYVVCQGVNVNERLVAEGLAGRYPFPGSPERPAGCPRPVPEP